MIDKINFKKFENIDFLKNLLFVNVYDDLLKDANVIKSLDIFNADDIFNYLNHHLKVLNTAIQLNNFDILFHFQVKYYSVFINKNIDCKFFLKFYLILIKNAKKDFYPSLYKKVEEIYNKLNFEHENIILLAKQRFSYLNFLDVDDELYDLIINGHYEKAKVYCLENVNDIPEFIYLFENKIYPILEKIGLQWESNKISVAKEHLASSVIKYIVLEFFASKKQFNKNKKDKVIVSGVQGESHALIIDILFNIFNAYGYEVYCFDSDLPNDDLIAEILKIKPSYLAFSITLESSLVNLHKIINKLKVNKSFDSKIIAGGLAFSSFHSPKDSFSLDIFCKSLKDILKIIK